MPYFRFMTLLALISLMLTGCDSAVGAEEETQDTVSVSLQYFKAIRAAT